MAARGTAGGRRRQVATLAALVGGFELVAVGAWYVLRGLQVHQSGMRLAVYSVGAVALGTLLWWAGYRRPTGEAKARVPAARSAVGRPRRMTVTQVDARESAIPEAELRHALLPVDRMDPRRFAAHVAALCRRDGFTDVVVGRVGDDGRDVDVRACDADGRTVVLRCRAVRGDATVSGAVLERFAGDDGARRRVVVTSAAGFSVKARAVARERGIALLDRRALAVWEVSGRTPEALA